MSDNEYPNLGFNPVPGMPAAVESLHGKVSSVVDSMSEANNLMARLRNADDSVWQGPAGDAFRQHFDSNLADELDKAHQSLGKAVGVIQNWHTDLVGFKDTAGKLETEAAAARDAQTKTESALQQAKSNPDLQLAGRVFTDPAALQAAQAKLNSAQSAVQDAAKGAQDASNNLQDIIKRAQGLQQLHEAVARAAAQALKDATENLAPHKPGMLSRMFHAFTTALSAVGDWVKNHLQDIHAVLSTISAIGGLLALCTPPPVDAIALGVSLAAGAGALATDIADPQFRQGIGQLLQGNFNKESLGALTTGIGDALSLVPGFSVGLKAATGGKEAAQGVEVLARSVAQKPGLMVVGLSKIPMVAKAGEAATWADRLFGSGYETINGLDRLNLFWKAKGVASHVYHDVKQATS